MTAAEFDAWLLGDRPPGALRRRPLVMGVLNCTPDSFSDGGRLGSVDAAVAAGLAMAAGGADLLDIGGESTRPGAEPVEDAEQIGRTEPVIRRLREAVDIGISIDTTLSAVAAAALDAGATIVNDVSAGRDDARLMLLVARRRAAMILMHMLGRPKTMQQSPRYGDVVAEVAGFLNERIISAGISGIDVDRLLVDPGIGFGKTTEHNLALIRSLNELTTLGRPLVVGTSRKRFIGEITRVENAADRVFGTAATVTLSIANGASLVRVHDVAAMRQVVDMTWALVER